MAPRPGCCTPATGPTSIDLEEAPWCSVVGFGGLARQALERRVYRARREAPDGGYFGPEQPWEREAIALEADIWSVRHRPDAGTAALRRRADRLIEACEADGRPIVLRWRT